MKPKLIALLVNRDSGDGGAERVEEMLERAGGEVRCFDVREPDRAATCGAARIVVAGGDGSIGFAAAEAADCGIELAVVPAGTANDFAARVGLPDKLEAACELAVNGTRTRCLDLAWTGDRPFVNVASVGLSPAAAEHAHGLKGRLGPLAYTVGAIRAGALTHPVRCRVSCDGREIHEGGAWQVSIAGTGAFGGGSQLDADDSDGELDTVVIEASSRLRLIKHAYGLRAGGIEAQAGVEGVRGETAEIRLEREQPFNVDGEVVPSGELAPGGAPVGFRIAHRAFELVVG